MRGYILLLRGINVSGHNLLKMSVLREALGSLKFKNIATYLQSGNAVWHGGEEAPARLTASIAKALKKAAGIEVPLFVVEQRDLKKWLTKNPFLPEKQVDPDTLYVTVLSDTPVKADVLKLQALDAGEDRVRVHGKIIYLHCPSGYGKTKLSNAKIEKILGLDATTRNWKTINALYDLASALPK